jgi:hypothetical protein
VIDLTSSSPKQFAFKVNRRRIVKEDDFDEHISISDDSDGDHIRTITKADRSKPSGS